MSGTQGMSPKADRNPSAQEMSLEKMGNDTPEITDFLCRVQHPHKWEAEWPDQQPHTGPNHPGHPRTSFASTEKGETLRYTQFKSKDQIPQSAEEQSLHEISKHKLQANLLLTSRNPAANNCMRQNRTSFFC